MKIGILTCGHTPEEMAELGDYDRLYPQMLAGKGFDFVNYNVVDGAFPDAVTDADGWLVSGSKHGAYEAHDWIPPLEEFIRQAHTAAIPVVGVCFGHQIVAQALGGKVEKFDGGWSVGRTEYTFGGQTFALNAWHQDQVTILPVGAQVVGHSDFCANAALVYDNRAFTMQPHPEFEADFIEGLIRNRGKGVVPDDLLEQAQNTLPHPVNNADMADIIARFFRDRRIA